VGALSNLKVDKEKSPDLAEAERKYMQRAITKEDFDLIVIKKGMNIFGGNRNIISQLQAGKTIKTVTNDGFPLKSFVPQGKILVEYESNYETQQRLFGTPADEAEIKFHAKLIDEAAYNRILLKYKEKYYQIASNFVGTDLRTIN